MKTTRILFVMSLILAMGMQVEAKKVKLQYGFKAGDQFKLERTVSQDITQEMMGQSQTMTNNTRMTYEFKVTEVSASGDMTMQVALVSCGMAMINPMGDMKYDSETDEAAPDFAKSLSASLNEVYTITLSQLGVISDIKVPEGLEEKVTKILSDLAGSQMAVAASAAGAAVNADAFRLTMSGFFISFPDGGVQVKKPWEAEVKTNQIIAFNSKTKSELVKAGAEENEIKITSQITQDPSTAPMEMEGMSISYQLMGASEGTLLLDAVTGLVKTNETVTSITGNIVVESTQLPEPMSIPMTVRSTEKISRK